MSFGKQSRLYAPPKAKKRGWHYAGKLDLLAEVDAPEYDLVGIGVLDWKSSKKPSQTGHANNTRNASKNNAKN